MEYKSYTIEYGKSPVIIRYLNNPVSKQTSFYNTGLGQSLESIIHDKPKQDNESMDGLFANKSRNLKATIKALFNEVMLRENLSLYLGSSVDESICKHKSYLRQIKTLTKSQYLPELSIKLSNRRTRLENTVRDLEKEKRQEQRENWRDLMFLKKYLLSALKDYWDLSSNYKHLTYDSNRMNENEITQGDRGYMQKAKTYNRR